MEWLLTITDQSSIPEAPFAVLNLAILQMHAKSYVTDRTTWPTLMGWDKLLGKC